MENILASIVTRLHEDEYTIKVGVRTYCDVSTSSKHKVRLNGPPSVLLVSLPQTEQLSIAIYFEAN